MSNKLLSSSSIEGTDVKNEQGESLGEIKDLMINPRTGDINYAVLSFGGFLGMGEKYFAIPWKAFSIDREDEEMVLNITKQKLEKSPGFDKDNWPSTGNDAYLMEVNSYYSYSPEVIDGLNGLLTKNYDSEAGYKNALSNSSSPTLKSFFKKKVDQRYQFGHEIKELIKGLGGVPEKGTSVPGSIHRTWIDFKTALSFDNEEAILEECERGESYCLEQYNDFLNNNALTAEVRAAITSQRDKVASALRKVDALEDVVD